MDLIYMNAQNEDVGVLHDYEFDLAFGKDENDFQLTLDRHLCGFGYYVYIDGTEYGGIIDSINVNTATQNAVYKGRTWHGILENKILCPDDGTDYLTLNGEANSVLAELIERMDLTDLFSASEDDSGVLIDGYEMNRFIKGYKGIRKMLESVYCKLKITFRQGKVQLSAVPRVDYSNNEEFDSSQVDFSIAKNDRPCNHLVCLGSGELKDRHVIHLFTDENGGIQPYTTTDTPLQDSDYILDTSQQVLFGADEVACEYDYSSAQSKENYVLVNAEPDEWGKVFSKYYSLDGDKYVPLESWQEDSYTLQDKEPSDWNNNAENYFLKNSGGGYDLVGKVNEKVYTLQTEKPSDWQSKYSDYFSKSGDEYSNVSAETVVSYKLLEKKPGAWSKEFAEYYTRTSDGTAYAYNKVNGVSKKRYNLQTMKPSDWDSNFAHYFAKKANSNGFESVKAIGADNPTYTLQKAAPTDWKKNYQNYYTYHSDGTTQEYKNVSGISKKKYVLQTGQPSDWDSNFDNYFVQKKVNGKTKYENVSMEQQNVYTLVRSKPSDWENSYLSYWMLSEDRKEYIPVRPVHVDGSLVIPEWEPGVYYNLRVEMVKPKWKKSTYYTAQTYYTAPPWTEDTYYTKKNPAIPKWEKGKYYTAENYSTAPQWAEDTYYQLVKSEAVPVWVSGKYYTQTIKNIPTWAENTYYTKSVLTKIPKWKSGVYYEKLIDNFAELVKSAIEKLKESANCDELSIGFEPEKDLYDIGDIVGASDSITGLALWQAISKKIVTITKDDIQISYEVGE